MANPEISKPYASSPQEWKPLQEIVASVNCDSRDKLIAFIHKISQIESGDGDRRKSFMLNYLIPQRQQFLKLQSLVKWSEHADIIKNCESYHQAVQNQQRKINIVEQSLETHANFMPSTSVRSPDIITAIDVLTTGRYQRFPKAIEEYFAPKPLTDNEVKKALEELNSVIELRMLTEEVVPPAMRKYLVDNGRITFSVEKEFEVVLTLLDQKPNFPWHIVDLKFLIQSANDRLYSDIDLSLHEVQTNFIIQSAQMRLYPKNPQLPELPLSRVPGNTEQSTLKPARPLPLLELYDFLHTFCLDMQLDILYQQAYRLAGTRWANNLFLETDGTHLEEPRTFLRVYYWRSVKSSSNLAQSQTARRVKSDAIEIIISEEITKRSLIHSSKSMLSKSHWLTDTSRTKPGVLNDGRGLNYPHKFLQARWTGLADENAEWTVLGWEFDPTNLSFEHLLLSVTQKHAESVILGFKNALSSLELAKNVFSEEDLEIIEGCQEFPDDFISDDSPISDNVAKRFLKISSLRVWLLGDRYITISIDIRSGRVIIEENNKIDDEEFIRMCEDKISSTPNDDTFVQTLCFIKFKSRIDQTEKAAKYLQFDIHRDLILRKEDLDQLGTKHLVYFRFPQYDDHFLICGIVNEDSFNLFSREPPVKRYILVKDAKDPTHKLSSIEQIYLEEKNSFTDQTSLELHEKDVPLSVNSGAFCGKRSFEEIDVKIENTLSRKRKLVRANAGLEYEIVHLARISSLCRARISYLRMKKQIKLHDLSFTTIQPEKSLEFIDPDSSISLTSSIPVVKMDRKSLLAKMPISIDKALNVFGDIYIRFVGSRLLTTTTCSILLQAFLSFGISTLNYTMDLSLAIKRGNNNIRYDPISQVISFKYDAEDVYIKNFLRDWINIVMICQAASQVSSPTWTDTSIKVAPFNFQTVKVIYSQDNGGKRVLNIIPRSSHHIRLIWSQRILPFSTSEQFPKYGLDIEVREENKIFIYDTSLDSRITSLKRIPLWEKFFESVTSSDIKNDNISINDFIPLSEGFVIPISDTHKILEWLDKQIRLA
ncbi:8866_t:CDS:10 [Gigaspora margarita]|uniref:Mediator of RNA polymerase II transcription subunit 14 n=1 Tax=Gigaspora margarita TaxID=4874 RepID=A0ABM8W586_GIGMA|nr:8866_t:CDS:10 [Gigaspora margarita]